MCGIVAILRCGGPVADHALESAVSLVAHRGPDGAGHLRLARAGLGRFDVVRAGQPWDVALGHRRLSILDLSSAGHQPMARGPLWITFNGEIYNFVELRRELVSLGHEFRSQSDTEVILAAYQQWGRDCFARFHGMWGLVLVDTARGVALAARDRLGIKPLYVARRDGALVLVSELKQLTAFRERLRPDEATVELYLATGYEPDSATFFADVEPVPAGTIREYDLDDGRCAAEVAYWRPERVSVAIHRPDDAAAALAAALAESTRLHLRSDVPVGCALSGGLDSSAVASHVTRLLPPDAPTLQTFTVTFPGFALDERRYVDDAVAHVGARAHFVTPTAEGFLDDLDRFVWQHDEPVGTLSQYAGYCLARLTRAAGVPVTLNGQGGDEVLSGYWQSYFMYLRGAARAGHLLTLARQLLGAALPGGNPEAVRQIPVMARRYLKKRRAAGGMLDRVMGLDRDGWRVHEIRRMYLPRLLKWDDRNFMAFSVEGRYPFLDHQVIETCLSMAPEALYARGWTKEPLRRSLNGKLPESIVRRRSKYGFEVPQNPWLAGSLRSTIDAWLRADSPLWALTDRTRVRQGVERFRAGGARDEEHGQEIMRHFLADRWLRRFTSGVGLAPAHRTESKEMASGAR
jgi:asparagine synthase (glutamine-hydrolysing)